MRIVRVLLSLKFGICVQEVTELRAAMAVKGAAALQQAGFLDAAQEILGQFRGSAGAGAAAAVAEAELRIALAQVCCPAHPSIYDTQGSGDYLRGVTWVTEVT